MTVREFESSRPGGGVVHASRVRKLAEFQGKGGKKSIHNPEISEPPNSGLRLDRGKWLQVCQISNGASWYRAANQGITPNGGTKASLRGWGGLIRSPCHECFQAAGDFPGAWAGKHINAQEAYVLLEILRLFCQDRPSQIAQIADPR